MKKSVLICIGGASANYLALKLANFLKNKFDVHLIISDGAKNVFKHEHNIGFKKFDKKIISKKMKAFLDDDFFDRVNVYHDNDLSSKVSSGSFLNSNNFIGAFFYISSDLLSDFCYGKCDTLIKRVFFVSQKQGVKSIVSPRESPYCKLYIKNILKLQKLGCIINPPIFGSYAGINDLSSVENFIIGKWCDSIGIKNKLYKRWRG